MTRIDGHKVEGMLLRGLDAAGVDRTILEREPMIVDSTSHVYRQVFRLAGPENCASLVVELCYLARDDEFPATIMANPGTGRRFFEWDWSRGGDLPRAEAELSCVISSVVRGTYTEASWLGGFQAVADCGEERVIASLGVPWLQRLMRKREQRFAPYSQTR